MKKFLKFITWCFLSFITSIICTTIIAMLCFIVKKIGFVENINFKSTFFWVFVLPTHFLLYCFLSNYWDDIREKTPEIDDTDLNTYSNKDFWVARKNFNSEKQFCYDSSNPCPYCDTKFKHTALHCAVYFSDMERLKEVIELIKKADEVDDYYFGLSGIFGEIFHTKDFRFQTSLILAAEIGNLEIIKLLLQWTKERLVKLEIYSGNNEWMYVNTDDEETLNRLIDSFQYKKKTQTGKDILNKDQEQQDLIKNEHEKRLRGN